jgi:hypothetical protein
MKAMSHPSALTVNRKTNSAFELSTLCLVESIQTLETFQHTCSHGKNIYVYIYIFIYIYIYRYIQNSVKHGLKTDSVVFLFTLYKQSVTNKQILSHPILPFEANKDDDSNNSQNLNHHQL